MMSSPSPGGGDFSLAQGRFLPTRADSVAEGELVGLHQDRRLIG